MTIDELVDYGLAETRFTKMRPDQVAFADHLMSSWGYRSWPSGKAFGCRGNYHVPGVRKAIKTTLERRP